jgi:hypothetical protein
MSKDTKSVKPVLIKDAEGNVDYTLTFTRETVKWAEQRGFKIAEVTDFPLTGVRTLFFYSFRAEHKGINSVETDKIFDELAVDRTQLVGRLVELYNATLEAVTVNTSEDPKNFKRMVEL